MNQSKLEETAINQCQIQDIVINHSGLGFKGYQKIMTSMPHFGINLERSLLVFYKNKRKLQLTLHATNPLIMTAITMM